MSGFNSLLLEITYRLEKEAKITKEIFYKKKIIIMLYPPTYGKLDTFYKPLIFIVVHDL